MTMPQVDRNRLLAERRFDMRPAPPPQPKKSILIGSGSSISDISAAATGSYTTEGSKDPSAAVDAVKDNKSKQTAFRPVKITKSISFDRATSFTNKDKSSDNSIAADPPAKQPFALPAGVLPMGKDGDMPQLVYMMPCGPMCHGGRCNDGHSCAGETDNGYSCAGDTTLNTSYGSMDSACERPLASMGKVLGRGWRVLVNDLSKAGRVCVNGMRETLDYGEALCNPANAEGSGDPKGQKWSNPSSGSVASQSTVMEGKMDELLRLMKENKEAGQAPKPDAQTHQPGDSVGAQAAQLLASVKDNLAVLNESAITQASELLGMGVDPPDEFVLERASTAKRENKVTADMEAETPRAKSKSDAPIVRAAVDAKEAARKADELAFEFNAQGLSISGDVERTYANEADKENVDPSSKQAKKPKRGMIKQMFKDITGSTKNVVKDSKTRRAVKEQKPFANFPSPDAVDSMGFPSAAVATQPAADGTTSWQADFDASNPFASNGTQTTKFSPSDAIETKVCAWCKKGGKFQPEVVKKLKLCSRCQATYYCSAECQGKDWARGHATSCQPNSVAMY